MILSIDCGSTNLKAAVYDPGLRLLAAHSVPLAYSRRDAVHAEFEADPFRDTFLRLIREAIGKAGVRFESVTRLAVGSQAQTFCLLDAEDRPLSPFISWMDVRAEDEGRELAERFGPVFHRHCSFGEVYPALQCSKMLWLRNHAPEAWARGRRVVSMPGYLFLKLAGLNLADANLAAMSGLYSMEEGGWWGGMREALGVPRDWLPEVVSAGAAVPARLSLDGRHADAALVPAGNDHTAGAAGNGCRPGEIIVTFGTALVAYCRCGGTPGPFHAGGCWGPYPLGGYYELASSSHGCSALDWAREVLLPGRSAADFDALAMRAAPGCGGLRFHPEKARTGGAWEGRGGDAEKARAVLEGILFTLRAMLGRDVAAPASRQVCALGGGSKSRIWMQLAADILGCTVRPGSGDSLLGAAALAAGAGESLESSHTGELKPDPERRALYDDLIGRGPAA